MFFLGPSRPCWHCFSPAPRLSLVEFFPIHRPSFSHSLSYSDCQSTQSATIFTVPHYSQCHTIQSAKVLRVPEYSKLPQYSECQNTRAFHSTQSAKILRAPQYVREPKYLECHNTQSATVLRVPQYLEFHSTQES